MKTLCYTLGNNGHQPVSVTIQAGNAVAVGDVPMLKTGMLTIDPGAKVVIEVYRVNDGQIYNLKAGGFLTATESYI